MVIRCFHCKGLLQVDEKKLPPGRNAKIRCPHCKGIGSMPDVSGTLTSGATPSPKGPGGDDYPSLIPLEPLEQPRQSRDWKEAAIPRDAFKTFRYPEERENHQTATKPAKRGLPMWLWILISLVVVAFFAVLVNIILPGPAGVRPVVHTVPPEHAGPPRVTEENVGAHKERSLPGIQDR